MRRSLLVLTACSSLGGCAGIDAAGDERILRAQTSEVIYQVGNRRPDVWLPDALLDPTIIDAAIVAGRRENVCFRAHVDAACFLIGVGDTADLIIEKAEARYNVRVNGVLHIPAARFSPEYQIANRGQFQVFAPEVYELVNVAIALTEYVALNPGLVVSNTDYYARMRSHFESHRAHPFVQAISQRMQEDVFWYFKFKMNGYAFEFDERDRIIRSAIYDRTGFNGDPDNDLLPLIGLMQDFARESEFRAFYAANHTVYRQQVAYFENDADVAGMWAWLVEQFPDVRAYDGVKVVFSPLVGPNQSVTWLEEDGYRELQAHINFPYTLRPELSDHGAAIARSEILFTEVNHGFINPTADLYLAEIETAVGDRSIWADDTKSASHYNNDLSLFLEYLNWGLIGLYEYDKMREPDRAASRARIERNMVERRGFKKFSEFNRFLIDIYAGRTEGASISDLYPIIIEWFSEESLDESR